MEIWICFVGKTGGNKMKENNFLVIWFYVSLFSLILVSAYSYFTINTLAGIETKYVMDIQNNYEASKLDTEYKFIEMIGEKFAKAHNYTKDYKCLNYSQDYYFVMKSLGYNVTLKTGFINKTTGHRWNQLIIDIEPITGQIAIDNEKTYTLSQTIKI